MKLTPDRSAWKRWRRAVRRRIRSNPELRRERRRTRSRAIRNYSWTNLRGLVPVAIAGFVLSGSPVLAIVNGLLLWSLLLTFVRAQQTAALARDPNQLWLWFGWPVADDAVFAHHRRIVLRASAWLGLDWLAFGLAFAWQSADAVLAAAAPVLGLAQCATALAIAVWLVRAWPRFPFVWLTTPLSVAIFIVPRFAGEKTGFGPYVETTMNVIHAGTPAGWLIDGWGNVADGYATGWWVLLGIFGLAVAALIAGGRALRKTFDPGALFGYEAAPAETGADETPESRPAEPAPMHRETAPVDLGRLRLRTEAVLAAPEGRTLARLGAVEQALGWFLTARQRRLVDFMVPRGMPWTRRWLIAAALLAVAVLLRQTPTQLGILPALAALAFALPITGGRWLGFEALRTFQTQVGLTSYAPIGFGEISRLVLTLNALYCLAALPLVLAIVWLGFAPAHATTWWALDHGLRGLGLLLALQPVWLMAKFSANTNDSSAGKVWFAGLVAVLIGGLVVGISLCVVALMTESAAVALGCVASFVALTHTGLALYGWAWNRGWFDLIAKLR